MMRSVPYALVGGLTLQCGAPRIGGPWKLNFSLESGISGTKLCQKRNSNEKVLGKVYDRLLLLSCPYGMSLLHISVFTTHQCLYYTSFFLKLFRSHPRMSSKNLAKNPPVRATQKKQSAVHFPQNFLVWIAFLTQFCTRYAWFQRKVNFSGSPRSGGPSLWVYRRRTSPYGIISVGTICIIRVT